VLQLSSGVRMVLQSYNSGVTVVLQWWYSGVTVILQLYCTGHRSPPKVSSKPRRGTIKIRYFVIKVRIAWNKLSGVQEEYV
jgi:hypothetical protein